MTLALNKDPMALKMIKGMGEEQQIQRGTVQRILARLQKAKLLK